MNRNGVTLIELIAVMAIIGILLTIGTLSYNKMNRKYAMDNQTRMLFTDLMETRLKAMYKKKSYYVTLASAGYTIFSSGSRTGPKGKVQKRLFFYPITSNVKIPLMEFDAHGLTNDERTVCIRQNETEPQIDSLVISTARINMGKRKAGKVCGSDNIDLK